MLTSFLGRVYDFGKMGPKTGKTQGRAENRKKTDFFTAPMIFAAAFLLFQVQPLAAKFLLPSFGGSQAVWTTCMLFFQTFLLAGYQYAHLTARFFSARTQAVLHAALLAAALAFLPVVSHIHPSPGSDQAPAWRILLLLTRYLGLPYFMLAASGPLLQKWFSLSRPEASPYRLYALSNAASLLALVSFPFVFEPALTRQTLARLWIWSFGAVILLSAANAWRLWRSNPAEAKPPTASAKTKMPGPADQGQKPAAPVRFFWFILPACGSALMLATTNKLCQDVAAIPFLWIVPLSLYLVTFILCFDRPGWYRRGIFTVLLVPLLGLLCDVLFRENSLRLPWQAAIYCGSLFVGCMVCHGEVSRLKPAPRFLTLFYLYIAAGGAAGGAFVAVLAPLVFRSFAELNWSVWLLAALVLVIHARERTGWRIGGRSRPIWPVLLGGVAALGTVLVLQSRREARDAVVMSRNFYGVLRVIELAKGTPYHAYKLRHGDTNHGLQLVDPDKAGMPTTYYHERSGVGLTLDYFSRQTSRKIGVVGLGTGTLAAYGRPGDIIRFYEINPDVRRLAETRFTFLKASAARVEVVPGDARLSLESEPAQQFDILVLDAFSSDAIPVHLLTKEAFLTYLRHLKTDGVIAVHVSNRHLNLFPVMLGAATNFDLALAYIHWWEDPLPFWYQTSKWILLSRNRDFMNSEAIRGAVNAPPPNSEIPIFWTDDYANVFGILNR